LRTIVRNRPVRRVLSGTLSAACAACLIAASTGGLEAQAPTANELAAKAFQPSESITVGSSYHNDTTPPLREMRQIPVEERLHEEREEHEASPNPKIPHKHVDAPDGVVQPQHLSTPAAMPVPGLNFDGIPFPGVGCNCAPPDTDGEVGATQYVQMVNEAYQVFDKATGASVLGPASIASIWTGFGGVCETSGDGDPVVMYDQLANRWVITQFAGATAVTDECIAVSTTPDATGTWNRYGFHLGSSFFDYPHLGVWPDAYYMSMNVFNTAGSAFLGPQAFAFNRAAMLAGTAATFITPGITGGPAEDSFLPVDLDGTTPPSAGAPAIFVEAPFSGAYKVFHFHVDFATPGNSTFTLFASPASAAFTELCPATRACVPEPGGQSLDGIGDRLMYRLAYRNFGDHESVVGNITVNSSGVAGIRWFELRGVTAGPVTVYQESTYQPDTTWRWMGSAAMDHLGNLAIGFSASSAAVNPQIRYAGRLVTDPLNQLSQGEGHILDGAGFQSGTSNRWGDYSALTVDPLDDCTFWYTNEYYEMPNASFAWKTRIANFRFPSCTSVPTAVVISAAANLTNESCAAPNGVIDPGETVTVNFSVQNIGSATTSNLVGTLQNTGGVTEAGVPQTYGAVAPGASVTRPFTFKATGICGGSLTATIQLQDGATSFPDAAYSFTLGVLTPTNVTAQNFDGVGTPALPAGWATAFTGGEVAWVSSTTAPSSSPNDAFAPDVANVGDTELVTPVIAIPLAGARLTFRNLYNMENTFDGVVLEVSIDGGAFTDATSGGNAFLSGGYSGTISTSWSSPIAGRPAWTGLSSGTTAAPAYITSAINLPAAANGHNVQLKWRAATDSSLSAGGAAGVRIDTITIDNYAYVCASCAAVFTDSTLVSQATVIKAVHITELRTRINAIRAAHGLAAFSFTDPTLNNTILVKAIHIAELRTALSQAYTAAALPPPTFSDPILVNGVTPVKAVHLNELRAAVIAIE
jgi:hypothetical protein